MAKEWELNLGRVILGFVTIVLLHNAHIVNPAMKKFIRGFIIALILEEIVLSFDVYELYTRVEHSNLVVTWRIYEIIRSFTNLSLCYPIIVLLGRDTKQLQSVFLLVVAMIVVALIFDFNSPRDTGHLNHFAFLVIFAYTYYQYRELYNHLEGDLRNSLNLPVLMLLEQFLIGCTAVFVIALVFLPSINGYPFRFCVGMLQYVKFYLVPSTMGSVSMQRTEVWGDDVRFTTTLVKCIFIKKSLNCYFLYINK